MNVNLMRLKPVVRELRGIRDELARIADYFEADAIDRQLTLPKHIKPVQDAPELFVTDEEEDFIKEMDDMIKQAEHRLNEGKDV